MKKLFVKTKEKIDNTKLRTQIALLRLLNEEKGDTNFLSIAIILMIVIGVAGAFIAFKDQIMGALGNAVNGILGKLNP